MNKVIQELCQQSWNTYPNQLKFDTEKFAELIIEECIGVISNGGEFCSRPILVEKVKRHFGIEDNE